jgi:branched-chain amino acid transport system permease protein
MAVLLDGVVFGVQLGLLGAGLTLLYGLAGVVHLAYGQLVVVAALAAAAVLGVGGGLVVAGAVAVATGAVGALLVDRTVLAPVHRLPGEERVLVGLLVTLGVAFAVDGVLVATRPFASLSVSVGGGAVDVAGVPMRAGSLVAAAIALVCVALLVGLLLGTRTGRAVRSVLQDETGARLCGIDPVRMRTLVVVAAGSLAGVVAVTQSLSTSVGSASGFSLTILALIVAVVGGLGRVGGALVAGLLLGVVHAGATAAVGTSLAYVLLLLATGLTLVVRPSGVLGVAR